MDLKKYSGIVQTGSELFYTLNYYWYQPIGYTKNTQAYAVINVFRTISDGTEMLFLESDIAVTDGLRQICYFFLSMLSKQYKRIRSFRQPLSYRFRRNNK
jgi:hypothetical protein